MIEEFASLERYNTFGVAARARWLARVRDLDQLPGLLARDDWRAAPVLVLGEGSNVLFTRDYDGLVIRLEAQRITESNWVGDDALVRVEAGRNWHAFVQWSLAAGHGGIENLALIPGTVGAAPIQNIGAYGVELASVVDAVEVFDRNGGDFAVLDRNACGFAYRDSVFKSSAGRERYIVCAVRFRFRPHPPLVLDYPGIAGELADSGVIHPDHAAIATAICRIRRRKLPDPAELGNAGSFFKNPIVPQAAADALLRDHPALPTFDAGAGLRKLSAAWMIEQLGWKGRRRGQAGVAASHALVLVNHGGASGAEILDLATTISAEIHARFGVQLEPEPMII
jgi:UDP-N-acetylmuramate dehydrogenase